MPNAPFESDDDAMTIEERQTARMQTGDRQLVDLLTSVLTDPNLHTDTRMRLHEEIAEILGRAGEGLNRADGDGAHEAAPEQPGGPLPDALASVLVDPYLHTDTRSRLHQEIAEILASVGAPRQV